MEIKWSEDQLKIIEKLRGKNVLVAAAAGSGKTTVLVERIKRMVSVERIPVKSLMVVTFTKAAAAEMKEKIRKAFRKELKRVSDEDPELAKFLRTQIRDLASCDISTFDSFALNVVRRYFFKTDLEPGFGVLDEPRKILMIEDSLDVLLEEEFAEMRPEFIRFMDKYCGDRKPNKIRSLISEVYKKIMSMPHPWKWLEEQTGMLAMSKEDFWKSKLWKLMLEDIKRSIGYTIEGEKRAVEYLRNCGLNGVADKLMNGEQRKYENALIVAEEAALALEKGVPSPGDKGSDEGSNWDEDILNPEYVLMKLKLVFDESAKLAASKDEKEAYEQVKKILEKQRNLAKEHIKGIKDDYISVSLDRMILEMNDTAQDLEEMIRLLKRFHQLFKEQKAEAKLIDFTDMEHYCLEILEDPEVAGEYRDKFNYIFIDEYQDTNFLQEAIVDLIKKENNLFMVGDVKQSIYRFRQAEPAIFQEKYASYSGAGTPLSEVVDLNKNYRSKDGIIKGINKVFQDLMDGYDERAELHTGVDYDGPCIFHPELRVISKDGLKINNSSFQAEGSGEDQEEDAAGEGIAEALGEVDLGDEALTAGNIAVVEREAKYVARLVKEHLGRPFFDGETKSERGLEPRDIVILLRSVKGYAKVYSDALSEVGIESYTSESGGYFDTMEIEIFMNLLSVIDNRRRDVELLSVLHSDLFGFSAKDLAEIRNFHKLGSYADAFFSYAEKGPEGELRERSEKVLMDIERWRKESRVMPLQKFLWSIMIESGFYLVVGAMPGGALKQANLRALVDRAESFAKDRQASLYSFVRYVGELRKRRVSTPEVKLVGDGDQVVRIMTIHKSKGLEFPMIILAGAGRELKYSDRGAEFVFHRDIGVGLKYVDVEGGWYRTTLPQRIIFRRIKEEEQQEQERILYVALTRAKDYLYAVGTVDTMDSYELGRSLGRRSHRSFIDMIGNTMPYEEAAETSLANNEGMGREGTIAIEDERLSSLPDEKIAKKIKKILGFEYSYGGEERKKSKYSVSELNAMRKGKKDQAKGQDKNREEEQDKENWRWFELEAPPFAREKRKLSGAEKGTIYHSVMEFLDFSKALSGGISYIKDQADRMVKDGIITQEELNGIDLNKIEGFFKSDIGARASKAAERGELFKERPFTLREREDEDDILIQGIIDCYFKENGRTVLLDYKSNFVREGDKEGYDSLLETYRTQLEVYKKALELSGEGPVEEVYLYLFSAGEAVKA